MIMEGMKFNGFSPCCLFEVLMGCLDPTAEPAPQPVPFMGRGEGGNLALKGKLRHGDSEGFASGWCLNQTRKGDGSS